MNPKEAAQAIISELEILSPYEINVELIAAHRNAYVRVGQLTGAEAKLVRLDDKAFITIASSVTHEARKRFNIGHELGHFELHKNSPFLSCSAQDMNDWTAKSRKETEANQFSAELLMPDFLFRPKCIGIPGMKTLKALCREFQTSLTATAIKFLEATVEPCALIFSVNGNIDWQIKNRSFDYYLRQRGERVHGCSYAHDAFLGKEVPADGDMVPAYAWVEGHRIDPDASIKECTSYSPVGNSTLTLLWVNEDIG